MCVQMALESTSPDTELPYYVLGKGLAASRFPHPQARCTCHFQAALCIPQGPVTPGGGKLPSHTHPGTPDTKRMSGTWQSPNISREWCLRMNKYPEIFTCMDVH